MDLTRWDAAVDRFDRASRACQAALVDRVPHRLQSAAAESAQDISTFCPMFRHVITAAAITGGAHTKEIADIVLPAFRADVGVTDPATLAEAQEKMARLRNLQESDLAKESQRLAAQLKVGFKSLFYFVRAHQDLIYRCLLELIGQRSGTHSSMNRALKSTNPVRELIEATDADYFDWFVRWRDQRNRIKEGAGFSIAGPDHDIGITFLEFTNEGGIVANCDPAEAIRLSHAVEALERSTRLADITRTLAVGSKV